MSVIAVSAGSKLTERPKYLFIFEDGQVGHTSDPLTDLDIYCLQEGMQIIDLETMQSISSKEESEAIPALSSKDYGDGPFHCREPERESQS